VLFHILTLVVHGYRLFFFLAGYPPLPNDHDGFSCGEHKDYGCLTFLWADSTRGALQVYLRQHDLTESSGPDKQTEDGIWINADPIPGCVVCNIGEMWETWTNGLYKSTLHRVVHRGTNYRVSIPFFYEPNFTALVKPLRAALSLQKHDYAHNAWDGSGKIYHPIVYGDFLLKKVGNNFDTGKGKYD